MSSLWQINLNIDDEYKPMINDVYRMFIIQIVAQILFCFTDPINNSLFEESFIQTLFYILLGICTYWLVIKKILIIN